jgi:hypothetical protein
VRHRGKVGAPYTSQNKKGNVVAGRPYVTWLDVTGKCQCLSFCSDSKRNTLLLVNHRSKLVYMYWVYKSLICHKICTTNVRSPLFNPNLDPGHDPLTNRPKDSPTCFPLQRSSDQSTAQQSSDQPTTQDPRPNSLPGKSPTNCLQISFPQFTAQDAQPMYHPKILHPIHLPKILDQPNTLPR